MQKWVTKLAGTGSLYTDKSRMKKAQDEARIFIKWIRHELQGEVHEPKKLPDYPADIPVPETVEITVTICDEKKTIKASSNDTLLLFNYCD